MSDSGSDGTAVLLAFVAGAVVGVGLGLLFAPQTGKETREQVADLARRAREKAVDLGATLRRDAAPDA
ncbi:MAG TPA: YtxH domain-containing protein [Candidatus Polarisedimenticolia bacterium]|jgi:gas vesicle protein